MLVPGFGPNCSVSMQEPENPGTHLLFEATHVIVISSPEVAVIVTCA